MRTRTQAACIQSAINGFYAGKLPEHDWEALADDAFLSMAKLRDKLVLSNRNTAACRVDEAIEALQVACREFVK
jgi:hypothetical protein